MAFYTGLDKYKYLAEYLDKVWKVLDQHIKLSEVKLDPSGMQHDHATLSLLAPMEIGGEQRTVEFVDGGDAAFGAAAGGLASVAAQHGRCLICEGLKQKDWFDDAKMEGMQRRSAWRSLVCSHTDPYSRIPASAVPAELAARGAAICPACEMQLTPKAVADEKALVAAMKKTPREKHLSDHQLTHYGYLLHQPKLQLCEYSKRHLTLLHHLLNSTATTLAVTCAAGATPAIKLALNDVLRRYGFWFRCAATSALASLPLPQPLLLPLTLLAGSRRRAWPARTSDPQGPSAAACCFGRACSLRCCALGMAWRKELSLLRRLRLRQSLARRLQQQHARAWQMATT